MTTPQQQQINAMIIQAAAYSAYALSLGIAMTTMGRAIETAAPPEPVLRDLRYAFGSKLVDEAIKTVGKEDVLVLATEIDRLFVADLREKYGDYATDAALQAVPPGETQKVHEVARVLSGRGITAVTPTMVREQTVAVAKKRAAMKYPPKPQLDTKTGKMYKSMRAAYSAVATEYGMDPAEHFGIYPLKKEDPTRFKDVSMEQYLKWRATQAA